MGDVVGYCEVCGKQFVKYRSYQKYCSDYCRSVAYSRQTGYYRKKAPVVKTCKQCGKEFTTNKSHQVYCSHECYEKHLKSSHEQAKVEAHILHCPICNAIFKTTHPLQKYCSRECYLAAKRNRQYHINHPEENEEEQNV